MRVSLDGPVQVLGFDAIDGREIRIHNHSLLADRADESRDIQSWDDFSLAGHGFRQDVTADAILGRYFSALGGDRPGNPCSSVPICG